MEQVRKTNIRGPKDSNYPGTSDVPRTKIWDFCSERLGVPTGIPPEVWMGVERMTLRE